MESDSILLESAASTSADFDAFEWVEKALAAHSGSVASLKSLVPQLTFRSQTLAQALHTSLQQVSLSGPTVQIRLQELQQSVTPLSKQLDNVHEACTSGSVLSASSTATAQDLRHLVTLHEAKCRLQSCSQALTEAAKWGRNVRECFAAVEDPTLLVHVFKSDNDKLKIRKIEDNVADHLADRVREMQTSLDVLKDLPGASDRKQTMNRLCVQIEAAVQPRLAMILEEDDLSDVAPLQWCLDVLGSVAKAYLVREEFCRARPARMHRIWNSYSDMIQLERTEKDENVKTNKMFVKWLEKFYADVLGMLQKESRNARKFFGSDMLLATLVDLLSNTLEPLTESFRDRLERTGCSDSQLQLSQLLRCFNVTRVFASQMVHLFRSVESDPELNVTQNDATMFNAEGILRVVFEPYRLYYTEYARFASEALTDALQQLVPAFHVDNTAKKLKNEIAEEEDQITAEFVSLEDFSQRLEEASEAVWMVVDKSLQQCYEFTGGAAFPEAIEAIGTAVQQFTLALTAMIPSIRKHCKAELNVQAGSLTTESFVASPDWSQFHASLALLRACGFLESQACALDSRVRVRMREQLAQFCGERSNPLSPQSCLRKKTQNNAIIVLADLVDPTKLVATVSKMWLRNEDPNRQAQFHHFEVELLDYPARQSSFDIQKSRYPSASLLDEAQRAVRLWTKEAQRVTFDTVFLPILRTLESLPGNESWQKMPRADSGDLPVFSMLPQDYITTVADLLLSLLPQLEPFAKSNGLENALVASHGAQETCVENEWNRLGQLLDMAPLELTTCQRVFRSDEKDNIQEPSTAMEFVDLWTETVASGTLAALLRMVCSIPMLTDVGAQQLAADLNYFHNVLSAVGGDINFIVDDLRRALDMNLSVHIQHAEELRADRDVPAKQALAKINDCIVAMRRQTLDSSRGISSANA
ncbi:Uncharacterized conserved protein [Plasmopara halstedii]|uniref:Conserved oligomeric Golgi complex subunit 7 n=1 Tax=Plasmopara halstedii TaxID=4781 RepID=A0A0P1AKJ8_PLAHL|nr:Uncharacterized conserved protein [Plasmopara halstedii]CEG41632.1 Uncharacterized conserved protein [Plasmopara halstedii]|eukprot:XP_024578001.1 Uncharacterized conserved protein [Plasmopara halstedii]